MPDRTGHLVNLFETQLANFGLGLSMLAKVYLPGYKRQPGDCKNENYLTRALCQ